MTAATPSQATTVRSLLVGWANEQDAWVRHLVSEVIVSRKAMTDSQLDAIYQTFLREKALVSGGPVNVPKLSDDASLLDVSSGLFLTQLHDLKNVNALAEGQTIDFNPKLTIVFGENACGKTGYVRVLKKAAAVRTTEAVLPDVSQAQHAQQLPSARIAFRLGLEKPQELEWKDQAGLAPFNRIDVFDSRATALHVDGDLNYLYTPGELARFPLVQQGIEGVRSRLEQGVNDRTQTSNPFLVQFDRQSRIYPLMDSLGAATDLDQLRALGAVTDAEKQEIPTLKAEVEALQTTNPAAQLKLAESVKQHLDAIIKSLSIVGRFDVPRYAKSLERFEKAEQQYEKATQESFAGLPIPGLLKEEWRRFIQAGEEYLKTLDGSDKYPANGEECLYCRHPLSPEAVALLKKYRDYCNNDLRTELDGAGLDIDAVRHVLQQGVDFGDVERRVGEVAGNGAGITAEKLTEIRDFVSKGKFIRDAIESRKPVEWTDQATQAARVLKYLEDAQTHNKTLLKDLTERRDKREEALRERQGKLLDIESRLKLAGLLPQIEKAVEQAKWVDKAKIQQRKFQGLLRSLTETSKVASEQLLNRDFERHFTEECKTLRAPAVTLQFPGRQGQVTRKKAVAGGEHRPSDVLSEGEQKVIALADFLAEASLKPPAPVVFDDPINSLDYKRMAEVVDRIVALGETRQVIVFTHNIWFTTELLARYEKRPEDCSYYDVARDETKIGIVSKGKHPRSDTVRDLRTRINTLIQAAEKASGETLAALIEKAYELIRNICEVIVEQELLQGVTQRYQPNVMMTKLPKINFNGLEESVSAIYPVYEDSCRYIGSHSQPLETLNVRPTLAMLKTDWKKVQDARDAYSKQS
ncbi:MAG: AAA family ATPase [Candidatus Binataceae bacterium]|jgi:recombinational DNA repair ATPase RecF